MFHLTCGRMCSSDSLTMYVLFRFSFTQMKIVSLGSFVMLLVRWLDITARFEVPAFQSRCSIGFLVEAGASGMDTAEAC